MHRLPRAIRLRQQHTLPPRLTRIPQRRFQSHVAYKPGGEVVRVQAVRFKKPFFTRARAVNLVVYGVAAYMLWNFAVRHLSIEIDLEEKELDEKQKKKVQERVEEDDGLALEDSFFIPLTWGKKLPKTYYKGSDPEWQEFIKVAKDKERQKKIQDDLVQVVFGMCSKHPGVERQLGKDTKIGKYWLDISFPDGPPQEYERSGIEIGDGFIAWSQQRISALDQFRLTRALWPKAAFNSFVATAAMMGGIGYRRIKQALGWEGKDPFSPEERYRHALELMRKQQQSGQNERVGKAGMEPNGNTGVVGSSTEASPESQSESQPAKSTASDDPAAQKLPWMLRLPIPSASSLGVHETDLPIAMSVFQTTLSKQWNPKKMEPPKGTFVVQGMVEMRGSTGRMLIDVQSCYDPRIAKFVTLSVAVRNFKRWSQSPRGGP